MIFIFCRNCGNKVNDSGKFCGKCGTKIEKGAIDNIEKHEGNQARRTIIMALICVSIVFISGMVTYFILPQEDEEETSDNKNKKIQLVENENKIDKSKYTRKEEVDKKEKTILEKRIDELNKKAKEQDTSSEYFGDSYKIEKNDLDELSREDVELLRNEIYARHGYIFKEKRFEEYFSATDWYMPNGSFNEGMFNDIEKKNIATILKYEEENGWR